MLVPNNNVLRRHTRGDQSGNRPARAHGRDLRIRLREEIRQAADQAADHVQQREPSRAKAPLDHLRDPWLILPLVGLALLSLTPSLIRRWNARRIGVSDL